MDLINLLELVFILIVSSPVSLDNLILNEKNIDYSTAKTNRPFDNALEGFIYGIFDWAKSVSADEGQVELSAVIVIVMALPSLVNALTSICPFINENINCDTLLLVGDVLFIGLGFIILILPIFGFQTIACSVNWTIPLIFNLFLPFIEVLGKATRAVNIALRLSSNLTAGHLLMILLSSFSEFLLTSSDWGLKLLGLLTLNFSITITCLESFLICIQTYVWSILAVYYLSQDE